MSTHEPTPVTDADATCCQLPGCDQPVEQPTSGGPRKRFCSDQHRVQFWRQTRTERTDAPRRSTEAQALPSSAALALRQQLEQSVQSLEGVLTRARTTLIELADLDEAEAMRAEAFSVAEERVARAQGERAAEERRRRAAENLAEAAAGGAQIAESEATQARQELEEAHAELERLRAELSAAQEHARQELRAVRAEAEDRVQTAEQSRLQAVDDVHQARQAQAGAEAEAGQLREELDQVRQTLRAAQDRGVALEQRLELEVERHRGELAQAVERQDKAHDRLERIHDELRSETQARATAEAQVQAAEQVIAELRSRLSEPVVPSPPKSKPRRRKNLPAAD